MHLKKIEVHNFRALRNIEIDFELELHRRIFPVGSLNGGGKSTLLQLTFILLHCSVSQDPDQLNFVKNLLSSFRVGTSDSLQELAAFTLVENKKEYCIRFYACQDTFIRTFLPSEIDELSSTSSLCFSSVVDLQKNKEKIQDLESEIETLERSIRQFDKLSMIEDPEIRLNRISLELSELRGIGIRLPRRTLRAAGFTTSSQYTKSVPLEDIQEELQDLLDIKKINLSTAQAEDDKLGTAVDLVNRCLKEKKLNYVTNYYVSQQETDESLLYKVDGFDKQDAHDLLKSIASKIFLAAPSTHIYLFLSQEERLSIFKTQAAKESRYFQALDDVKAKLDIFLSTYDFFETRFLIDLFTQARDKDFQYAIEKQGSYGDNYQNLLSEINSILPGKSINVTADLSQVTFTMTIDSEKHSILPEDLSHGELKKLNIYTWLRTYGIKDAIVLMDEPEIALHPDWQYNLPNDLWDWEPSNQYILATHSYEICQALTPQNIKEIEPKLLKDEH